MFMIFSVYFPTLFVSVFLKADAKVVKLFNLQNFFEVFFRLFLLSVSALNHNLHQSLACLNYCYFGRFCITVSVSQSGCKCTTIFDSCNSFFEVFSRFIYQWFSSVLNSSCQSCFWTSTRSVKQCLFLKAGAKVILFYYPARSFWS